MPKVPHRFDPIVMSINLAQKTKDPVRMADSVERLLSLGWPGRDEYFRIEAGNQVDRMVKQLRAEDKGAEADLLQKKLEESLARRLVRPADAGTAIADFDLSVDEPYGVTAGFEHASHRFRRRADQERLRNPPGRDLRLPPRLQRQVHDSRLQHLVRPQATGHAADARGDHPRGDFAPDKRNPEPQA